MSKAVISLGSNLGDKFQNIKQAIEALKKLPNTQVISISNFYETKPFCVPNNQNDYINGCVLLDTTLLPLTLLGGLLGIEAALGRERKFKNAERVIDLDLLLYDDLTLSVKDLILPHPRIRERAFVLIPLGDICRSGSFFNFSFADDLEKIDKTDIRLL